MTGHWGRIGNNRCHEKKKTVVKLERRVEFRQLGRERVWQPPMKMRVPLNADGRDAACGG